MSLKQSFYLVRKLLRGKNVVSLSAAAIALVFFLALLLKLLTPSSTNSIGNPGNLSNNDFLVLKGVKPPKHLKPYRVCSSNYTFHLPCHDPAIASTVPHKRNEHLERHCPEQKERRRCIVPLPESYKPPIPWPSSKQEIWFSNAPFAHSSALQPWVQRKGPKWKFVGKWDDYVDKLQKRVKLKGHVRTALDIGSGVSGFGLSLLDHGVLPLSISPEWDLAHKGQTLMSLERGVPAAVGALATHRLPIPSASFDLIHCANCEGDWLREGGILLLEVDRLLRQKGYFVLSGYPVEKAGPGSPWPQLQSLAQKLCWSPLGSLDIASPSSASSKVFVWQKSLEQMCVDEGGTEGPSPVLCGEDSDPDDTWGKPLEPCVSRSWNLTGMRPWPTRLKAPPIRFPRTTEQRGNMREEAKVKEDTDSTPREEEEVPKKEEAKSYEEKEEVTRGDEKEEASQVEEKDEVVSHDGVKEEDGLPDEGKDEGSQGKEKEESSQEDGSQGRENEESSQDEGSQGREKEESSQDEGSQGREKEESSQDDGMQIVKKEDSEEQGVGVSSETEDSKETSASEEENGVDGSVTEVERIVRVLESDKNQESESGNGSAPAEEDEKDGNEENERRRRRRRLLSSSSSSSLSIRPSGPEDTGAFNQDFRRWRRRVAYLREYLHGYISTGKIRNVMDVNAGLGGFAASLAEYNSYQVWVMNVIPTTEANTLPVVYDRGLIGVAHDWCEPFSTYPRTYDMIHASGIRFVLTTKACNLIDVMLEMNRILRPEGLVVVRDTPRVIAKVLRVARAIGWKTKLLYTEEGPKGKELLLMAQKPFIV